MKKLTQIIRHLLRNRLFTGLNISGLAIGISVCWVIFRLVNYEFSFDRDLPEREHIYRVAISHSSDGNDSFSDYVPLGLPPFIQDYVSSSELTVPIYGKYITEVITASENGKSSVHNAPNNIVAVNTNYFELVNYNWIAGSKYKIFSSPFEIILTSSRAKLYFPELKTGEIIGKSIMYDTVQYTVTGIVEDLKTASNFSGKEFIEISKSDWNDSNFLGGSSQNQMYVKVSSEKNKSNLLKIINNKFESEYAIGGYTEKARFLFVPLSEVHFSTFMDNSVDKKTIYGIIGIGFFLLTLSVINFINISTSQIPERAKNIGIRKTMGESMRHLALSFVLETIIICLVSFFLAYFLKDLLVSQIQEYIPENFHFVNDTKEVILFLIILLIVLVISTSIYPIYLSNKVQVVEVLKHKSITHIKFGNLSLKKLLIVLQFVVAQFFVVTSLLIGLQLKFMMNKDLGFDHNAIVNIPLPNTIRSGLNKDPNVLVNTLKSDTKIQDVALGRMPLSKYYSALSLKHAEGSAIQTSMKSVGDRYGRLFNLKLLAGRDLLIKDSISGIAITRRTSEMLGFDKPALAIGKRIQTNESNIESREIVGVYNDFNSRTLHAEIEPISFITTNNQLSLDYMNIKLSQNTKDWSASISTIEKEWKAFYKDGSFNLQFYDDNIKKLYDNDRKFAKIINSSAIITIFLSCLGLIGLITITTSQRTKEIGIRKVLGSSINRIIRLLSMDYIILIIVSILIATPIAWWFIKHWLSDFSYKIAVSWWMFSIPALGTLSIAFLTMFYHSLKAAKANPVDSLRDE
ncbi:ABC transporter permease [Sphingobacterium daejeonense]|uniref:ABC transporter permease n=1 Tax=Sphingobacterium daejeonense TaxID=371142 RepID=UPI0010C44A2D|nr:ABC transporter permease [Sphingobacterium daejeonense]VTP95868.1 Macrolide export ATP-binding/permease protein MacB [Sphingobacterium daejeonense]